MTTVQKELRARLEQHTTDELLTILRERNEQEWRPEVFGIVASMLAERGTSVIEAAPVSDTTETDDDEPLVTVARFPSLSEARTALTALESAGLFASLIEGPLGVGESRLQVRSGDEQAALAILDPAPSSVDLPPEIAEPPCRRC